LSIDDDQDCAAEDGTALNDRCASGICRSSDNKCGCKSTDHCDSDSGEVCHSGDNKCYVSGLYGQDCSVDDGTALDARCLSNKCRSSDNKCGCSSNGHCSSGEVCHTDNKCYTSGLSIDDDQDCAAEDGTALNDRCASGICRSSDNKCGCTSTDHCDSDSGEVCHSGDNKCYSSGLSHEQDCSADNGGAINARCASGFCRPSDKTCRCTSNSHCGSNKVCHTDNKCYSSSLGYDQGCAADNGGAINARCASGFCRNSDKTCRCTSNSHCPSNKACHTDNKCYSSSLGYGQSCAADNGGAINARCASGFCRPSDKTCRCTSNSHCPSNKACKKSTNMCVTQEYMFSADCQLGKNGEETTSRVALDVKRGGYTQVWIEDMDKPGGCPRHTFELAGAEPDEFEIKIHGNDALGVDYFTLWDETNGGRIKRWGADGGGGWCFSSDGTDGCWAQVSGANFPIIGVTLYKDGSEERIKFDNFKRCRGNQSCSSNYCSAYLGYCGTKKCCVPPF